MVVGQHLQNTKAATIAAVGEAILLIGAGFVEYQS
jgi:hypothetical protein